MSNTLHPSDRIWLDGTVIRHDSGDDEFKHRSVYERDCDILLYSSAFRRLKGVTQVLPVVDGSLRAHDRLIHSMKVAQVGKRIAQKLLRENDQYKDIILPDAVYFAGLAHDLGHPPFGHAAEKELQSVLRDNGGEACKFTLRDSFEGNAQTFRILVRLSQKRDTERIGMGLTVGSLIAVTKYPWIHGDAVTGLEQQNVEYDENALQNYYDNKWGVYDDDSTVWRSISDGLLKARPEYYINSQIMDLADDITYAIHDMIDHYKFGSIPPISSACNEEIFLTYAHQATIKKSELQYSAERWMRAKKWLEELNVSVTQGYEDGRVNRARLHELESTAVSRVIDNVKIDANGRLQVAAEIRLALQVLKQLTWYYVIENPRLSAAQVGQRRVIRELHDWLCEWYKSCLDNTDHNERDAKLRRIPARFREYADDELHRVIFTPKKIDDREWFRDDKGKEMTRAMTQDEKISRAAVDYIVSLTDDEAVKLHQNLGAINGVAAMLWLA